MQIEIRIDSTCKEPKVIIVTNQVTDEVNLLLRKFAEEHPKIIAGFKDEIVAVLELADIVRIFSSAGKVFAETHHEQFALRLRLYECEERLIDASFTRISNSEIINLKNVKGFDLSIAGTICVTLSNGSVTFVSRRYVSKIKQVLGI